MHDRFPSPPATVDDTRKQEHEREQVLRRSTPPGRVVYKAIVVEAEDELSRPTSALFWSGLAAGLSMGFSLIAQGLLRERIPDAHWAPLLVKLGYSVGFLIVILGRQQLFTENTLTPMLPLLKNKDLSTFLNVMRLWGVVLPANLAGAVLVAGFAARTPAFDPEVRSQFIRIGHDAMAFGPGTIVLKAIVAGWLIALMVWMLPAAQAARIWIIILVTYVVGLGHFSHIVAGSIDVSVLGWTGEKPWSAILLRYILPTLIGNIIGGVTLVAALNHAQVVAGKDEDL